MKTERMGRNRLVKRTSLAQTKTFKNRKNNDLCTWCDEKEIEAWQVKLFCCDKTLIKTCYNAEKKFTWPITWKFKGVNHSD